MAILRQHLGLILRLIISAIILVFLAREVQWQELGAIVRDAHWGWISAATVLFALVIPLSVLRWQILLQVQQIYVSFWRALEVWMIGHFFNAFLLGTTGGDVIKIYYMARAHPEQRSAAALSVMVDRIIGLAVLLLIAVVLGLWHWQMLDGKKETHLALVTIFLAAGAMFGLILTMMVPALWRLFFKMLHKVAPKKLEETVLNIHEAFDRYARAWSTNVTAAGVSLLIHFVWFTVSYVLLLALHQEHVPFWAFISILPIVGFLVAIPVSLAGFGVREGLFVAFLALLSVSKEHALAFSLAGFGVNLFWSLVGGVFYLMYRKPQETISNITHATERR